MESKVLKRQKSSKKSSKRSKKYDDQKIMSISSSVFKPLVEYSDVSSEDLSEPEAGEIQSEESPPIENLHHFRQISRAKAHSLRSPSPRNERKLSNSSEVSVSSVRKKRDTSPSFGHLGTPIEIDDYEYRKHRKKKDKKHKKDKKSSKKKKKKSKHRSRSSSLENDSPKNVPETPQEPLSDWEPPPRTISIEKLASCSPISPASNNPSPGISNDPNFEFSPRSGTPTIPPPKKFSSTSPHTPQNPPRCVKPPKSPDSPIFSRKSPNFSRKSPDFPRKSPDFSQKSPNYTVIRDSPDFSRKSPTFVIHEGSPNFSREEYRQNSWSPKSSPFTPFRNPSPDVQFIGMNSPTRKKRKMDSSFCHKRSHRKEKIHYREKTRRISRSRSPIMRKYRTSRSPSWSRRHYSRSSSRTRTSKRFRSRSPTIKRATSPKSPPLRHSIRQKSPSPHSVRSTTLKNKITDTSLFAELVKDRQKRELELRKIQNNLLEQKTESAAGAGTVDNDTNTNSKQNNGERCETESNQYDIENIPIPTTDSFEIIDENIVPNNMTSGVILVQDNSKDSTPPRSLTPVQNVSKANTPLLQGSTPVPQNDALNISKNKNFENLKKTINTKISKLPMPPGIKQTDLEEIESPPSRTPSPGINAAKPQSATKVQKTPPRKSGIMNLPMPPVPGSGDFK